MTRMNFYITDKQIAFLEKEAEYWGISASEALRRVLDEAIHYQDVGLASFKVVADKNNQ